VIFTIGNDEIESIVISKMKQNADMVPSNFFKYFQLTKDCAFLLFAHSFGSSIIKTGSSSMVELLETIGNSASIDKVITISSLK
jgi:hypothetical protein